MAAIRASEDEREAVATRLREAAGEGRLDADELDERLGAALQACTREGLVPLVADLPGRRRSLPRLPRGVPAYLAGNGALIGLWMAEVGARDPFLGESEFFWPIFPIVGWGMVLLRKRRPRLPAA
jgi:DUF1707 SHOCT-like domain